MKYIIPEWPAPTHVKAFTTTKHFPSANLDAALIEHLHLPSQPIWLRQTHSNIVVEATGENAGIAADSSFTTKANQVCIVQTADCLPIIITNAEGTFVSAIHAGWRGLAAGIIENTIMTLRERNNDAEDLLVWLGPAIGPKKFEVGKDVYQQFIQKNSANASGFIPIQEEKWLADLYHLAKISLENLHVYAIYGGGFCTYSQADLFYSYRRDKTQAGRMNTMVWISPK